VYFIFIGFSSDLFSEGNGRQGVDALLLFVLFHSAPLVDNL
jgi:hypothetical protein